MIVAICGRKGTGKTTAAEYLEDEYGFETYALAQPLKIALKAMFDLKAEYLYGVKKDEVHPVWDITPRKMLQTLGTDWAQHTLNVGRDIWVKRFKHLIWDPREDWAISDVRFQHELDALKHLDTVTSIQMFRGKIEQQDWHESEDLHIRADYAVFNDADHTELYKRLDEVMKRANHTKGI
jgi:hypothetical protein